MIVKMLQWSNSNNCSMNWTKIWKSCGYQLMGFQTLHWRRFYLCSLCFISSRINVVFRFSWKWPATRMTGRLSARCRPLVTEVCPAECGQPPACSGDNLRPRQEMRLTAVMSQVRLEYFSKDILYFGMKWGILLSFSPRNKGLTSHGNVGIFYFRLKEYEPLRKTICM